MAASRSPPKRTYRLQADGWLQAVATPEPSREAVEAAAKMFVDLFVSWCMEHADDRHKAAPVVADDYLVRFWAMYRGPADNVPENVLDELLERDPWWQAHPDGQPLS
ncbi:MAG: hypothetical protein JOZ81_08240 [Chloroflexi bacterium]|nr:hypothetical protein [Chloroflexota bacterium]